jgi:hypothetical protein
MTKLYMKDLIITSLSINSRKILIFLKNIFIYFMKKVEVIYNFKTIDLFLC